MIEAQIARPKLPVIRMAAYPQTMSRQELGKMEASYIFENPLELDQIREAIHKLI